MIYPAVSYRLQWCRISQKVRATCETYPDLTIYDHDANAALELIQGIVHLREDATRQALIGEMSCVSKKTGAT